MKEEKDVDEIPDRLQSECAGLTEFVSQIYSPGAHWSVPGSRHTIKCNAAFIEMYNLDSNVTAELMVPSMTLITSGYLISQPMDPGEPRPEKRE
jgi:hypothetical protein